MNAETTPTTPSAASSVMEPTVHRSSFARVPAAFRLHLVNRQLIRVPLVVFLLAWLLSMGIGAWTRHLDSGPGAGEPVHTGAAMAALWAIAFMAAYSGSHTFPFALALSFSRRVYLLGTLLVFLMTSTGYGLAFAGAALVEQSTDGLGLEIYTHALPFLVEDGAWTAGLAAGAAALMLMLAAFDSVMLYKRVSVLVLWLIILGLVALAAVAVMLAVQTVGWEGFWGWFGRQTALSLAGWAGLSAVVLAGVGCGLIRRATP